MKRLINRILVALFLLSGTSIMAQGDAILGTYKVTSPFNDDIAHVKITKTTKGTYMGRIVYCNPSTNADGSPRLDENNPDPKLRTRKPNEIIMCWNLSWDGKAWVEGKMYDVYSGKTWDLRFKPAKNGKDLDARYYKGVPAMGISGTWKRLDK